MKSLSYYLTLLVLRLKGVKKQFSTRPIDYISLRKEDIHTPSGKMFKSHSVKTFSVAETLITEVSPPDPNTKLILYFHGGAFVSGPCQHHWDTIKIISDKTNSVVWMVDYPKAPENDINIISKSIDAVYANAREKYFSEEIILIGDSVGGTLTMSLTQRLVQKNLRLPSKLILISPVVDSTLSNPEIEKIDKVDPILSKKGVLSAKEMCANNNALSDVRMSPINGSFKDFPGTLLFVAGYDITAPDQDILVRKMKDSNVDLEVIYGNKMPHVWPILPVMKEAKTDLMKLINWIK